MKLDSAHAVLDVKLGRQKLKSVLQERLGRKIPVTIKGHLVQVGNDDGVSIEFIVDVDSAVVKL